MGTKLLNLVSGKESLKEIHIKLLALEDYCNFTQFKKIETDKQSFNHEKFSSLEIELQEEIKNMLNSSKKIETLCNELRQMLIKA